MTPFDDVALLTMLLTFYRTVNGSELARARLERPEYFAGGVLFGSKGDKLQLADGRQFDLIANAGGAPGTQHWQVIPVTPGGAADPWPLEPGPVVPMDPTVHVRSGTPNQFEALVGGALASLGATDDSLGGAAQQLVATADAGALVDDGGAGLEPLERVADEVTHSRGAQDVAGVLDNANNVSGAVAATDADYDQAPPQPQIPNEPQIPAAPANPDEGGEPGRENPEPKHPDRD
jgi:hypothetical protein